jgi:hypothetical protein
VSPFVRVGSRLLASDRITSLDLRELEALRVTVHHDDGTLLATGGDAIELVMRLRPSALEGPKLRFARRAWAIHNLVGHPLMQLCALLGQRALGLWIHEATVPRPGEKRPGPTKRTKRRRRSRPPARVILARCTNTSSALRMRPALDSTAASSGRTTGASGAAQITRRAFDCSSTS